MLTAGLDGVIPTPADGRVIAIRDRVALASADRVETAVGRSVADPAGNRDADHRGGPLFVVSDFVFRPAGHGANRPVRDGVVPAPRDGRNFLIFRPKKREL